jgi:hypothetical protein
MVRSSSDAARGIEFVQHIWLEDIVEGDGFDLHKVADGLKRFKRSSTEETWKPSGAA